MGPKTNKTAKVATILVGVATLVFAIYIMVCGLGLQDSLPFGAGAYFYADIPDFEKYLDKNRFEAGLPYWVYVLLFLLWGALMYLLWVLVDKKK